MRAPHLDERNSLHACPFNTAMDEMADESVPACAVMDEDSLSSGELAAYLDGQLDGEELARVEAHLADQSEARQEAIKVSRIIASAPRRLENRIRWWPAAAGLAAIAALMFVAMRPRSVVPETASISSERTAVTEETGSIELISPGDGQRLASAALTFSWRPIEGATYRLVVTDASGRTVLQKYTSDTVAGFVEALPKDGIGIYYWSVDAGAPDGSSVTSGVHEFVVISPK